MSKIKYQYSIQLLIVLLSAVLILPTISFGAPPTASMIVGTPACPKLNAHNKKACRFEKGGHDFQVWPSRIDIKPTEDPNVWFLTDTGHNDLMFDHTIAWAKDDHVAFQCIVKNDGQFYGPISIKFKKGGVWRTYGKAIETAAAVSAGVIAGYFTAGAGTEIGAVAGGAAAEVIGSTLSNKFGNTSWEVKANMIARDICKALAR